MREQRIWRGDFYYIGFSSGSYFQLGSADLAVSCLRGDYDRGRSFLCLHDFMH